MPSTDPALRTGRLNVLVDGEPRPDLDAALLAAEVLLPRHGVAGAEVRLAMVGPRRTRPRGGAVPASLQDLSLGTELSVASGAERLLDAEVTGIEERHTASGPPELVLLADDVAHRMARPTHSRVFEEMSLGDLARMIAGEWGLQARVDDVGETGQWVQERESDLALLLRLADERGLSVRLVEGAVWLGRDERGHRCPVEPVGVHALRLVADLNRQPGHVVVQGSSADGTRTVSAPATPIEPNEEWMETATAALARLGWNADRVLRRDGIDKPRAQALADGALRNRAERFLHGVVECTGPVLRPGDCLALTQVSPRFAGHWLVGDVTHRFSSRTGLRVHADLTRPEWAPEADTD